MNGQKNKKASKVLPAVLIVLILVPGFNPAWGTDAICEKALVKCLVDAAVATILSGPEAGAAYVLGCLNGYAWCLTYFLELVREV